MPDHPYQEKSTEHKEFFDSDHLTTIKRTFRDKLGLNKRVLLLITSAVVGALVSLLAIGLAKGIELTAELTYMNPELGYFQYLMPMLGGLLVGLIIHFSKSSGEQGGGVEETIKLIRLKRIRATFSDILIRFFTSIITLGTGGSAGKEGPVVHLGGTVGTLLGRSIRFPDSFTKTLAGAGVAAAIATAFHAPIAGSFFALEILLASFTLDTFSMIIVAAVTSTAVAQSLGHVTHQVFIGSHGIENPLNLIFFVFTGILGGFVTVFFIKTMHASDSFFNSLPGPRWIRPAIGGLFMGFLAFLMPAIYGEGYNVMNILLSGDFSKLFYFVPDFLSSTTLGALLLLLLVKILATASTVGSGGSGGTIVPALFIGTTNGAILAYSINYLFPDLPIDKSTWVLVGMSSVIAPMTQAPIFSIMLFFELTRSYEVILPVLIVSTVSTLINRHFMNGSLYSATLEKQGIRLYRGMEQSVMETILVKEISHRKLNKIDQNVTLSTIINGFFHSTFTTGFVVDKSDRFIGVITLDHVKKFIKNQSVCDLLLARELACESNIWVNPETNLMQALEIMDKTDLVFLPVLDSKANKKPIGYITRKDIVSVYNRSVIKRGTQNIMMDKDGSSNMNNYLQIGDEFHMETITTPKNWINKTLKEIDLRVKFNLTVVGVKKEDDVSYIIPDINYRFTKGDSITVVGPIADVEKLLSLPQKTKGIFDTIKGKWK